MIEKLDEKSLTWNASDTSWVLFGRALYHKQCEIISHLNTQEEKAKQLGVATNGYVRWINEPLPDMGKVTTTTAGQEGITLIDFNSNTTASNQSNTELPKKIKLLKDRAGYPAGEYILGGEGGGYGRTYRSVSNERGCSRGIHIDIIKATSGQGIRSEVTDGEETVNFMQYADEPIPDMTDVKVTVAGPPCKACYGKKQHTQLHGYRARGEEYGMKVHMKDCQRCDGTGIEPTASYLTDGEEQVGRTIETCYGIDCPGCSHCEPTTESVISPTNPINTAETIDGKRYVRRDGERVIRPDPYEECTKEILELELKRKYKRSNLSEGMVEIIGEEKIEAILKKHFPPLSLT